MRFRGRADHIAVAQHLVGRAGAGLIPNQRGFVGMKRLRRQHRAKRGSGGAGSGRRGLRGGGCGCRGRCGERTGDKRGKEKGEQRDFHGDEAGGEGASGGAELRGVSGNLDGTHGRIAGLAVIALQR